MTTSQVWPGRECRSVAGLYGRAEQILCKIQDTARSLILETGSRILVKPPNEASVRCHLNGDEIPLSDPFRLQQIAIGLDVTVVMSPVLQEEHLLSGRPMGEMYSCSTRGHDFLSDKGRCRLAREEHVSFCSTGEADLLFNSETYPLVR